MNTFKLLANIVCALFVSLCIVSCGGITVKGENGQTFESYQECCAAQDFMAAHTYLAKMVAKIEGDEIKKKEYETAKEYVFKQEALYLMSIGDETAKKRIIYLLKEEGGNADIINMLIDLAIDAKDENFVKALTKQYNSKIPKDLLRKIVDFLYIELGEHNLDFVRTLLNQNNGSSLLLYAVAEKGNENIVIELLTAKERSITKRPQMGLVKFYGSGYHTSEFESQCSVFSNSVKSFNDICMETLSIAIKNKNKGLAQRIVSKFKSNIHVEDIGFVDDVHYHYKVSTDNSDIREAEETYQEAVKSGAFN